MKTTVNTHEPRVPTDNYVYTVELQRAFKEDVYTFEEYEDEIAYLTDVKGNEDATKQKHLERVVERLLRETTIRDVRTSLGEQMGSLNVSTPDDIDAHIPDESL